MFTFQKFGLHKLSLNFKPVCLTRSVKWDKNCVKLHRDNVKTHEVNSKECKDRLGTFKAQTEPV